MIRNEKRQRLTELEFSRFDQTWFGISVEIKRNELTGNIDAGNLTM